MPIRSKSIYDEAARGGDGVALADPAADLERELTDRFGAPPPAVRNLLYIVRLRVLAKRAGVASVAREDAPSGQPVLSIRMLDGRDLRAQLAPSARRELERGGVVTIGHAQMRIDLEAAGDGWREVVVQSLEAAAGEQVAATNAARA
jgi:hypothetical protein